LVTRQYARVTKTRPEEGAPPDLAWDPAISSWRERTSMRNTWLVGGVLILAGVLLVVMSDLFDLRLESTALLGVAAGAVVALVPDRTPLQRLVGFVAGFASAWIGYLLRAGALPDSIGGRAVTVGLVLLLCVVVAGLSANRVPLWSTLLGAVAMVGAYEYTYSAAPPEVTSTSVTAATALLMTAAVGYLAAALISPAGTNPTVARAPEAPRGDDSAPHKLDDLMENAK
jgi:hypothetical protein